MIELDGSRGEGGGQILRTALGLSVLTGKAFRISRIRARRERPGLRRQHLTAVHAAAEVGRASLEGANQGSLDLTFVPSDRIAGDHHFAVGTAGSTTLVLQTILPALITASGPSRIVLEGGTHNPQAPPFDFLEKAFLPLVNRMGPRVEARLDRPGYYPAGGGRFTVTVEPARRLLPIHLPERGEIRAVRARAAVARLPRHIAERELRVVSKELGIGTGDPSSALNLRIDEERGAAGPGNVVIIEVEGAFVTEVFAGFGARGVPAEAVAAGAASAARAFIDAGVPVGEHLADQLLVPMAIAGGGSFRTTPLSLHARTNIDVIRDFLDVDFMTEESGAGVLVRVEKP